MENEHKIRITAVEVRGDTPENLAAEYPRSNTILSFGTHRAELLISSKEFMELPYEEVLRRFLCPAVQMLRDMYEAADQNGKETVK